MAKLDRSKIPISYRDYLNKLKEIGEIREIDDEVDWYLEMGAIYRKANETLSPAVVFNNIKGSPEGFRAADFGMGKSGNRKAPWARLAVMLGMPPESKMMDILKEYLNAIETGEVHEPNIVTKENASCKENIWLGDEIDLEKFPAPVAHDGDGGRYIQTAGLNIVQTPDGKWTNWSTNRAMIIDKNTMTGLWIPAQHNGMIHQMWNKEGKNTPWACALGVSPAVATQAGARCPDWVDEYDQSSKFLDGPIDLVKCETNDLMVPAEAEIIIEGYVCKDEFEAEGPFGEYPGYIPDEVNKAPKQVITAITFRNKPILPICLPGVPIDSSHVSMSFFRAADIVKALQQAELPVIDAMILFESANHWLVIRVKDDWHQTTGYTVDQFIRKIGDTFWGQHVGSAAKLVIVGEDIDPSNSNDVIWAMATRNHPKYGTYLFEDINKMGAGTENYHAANEKIQGKGGLAIYSCLPLQERVGLPPRRILSFEKNYPDPIKKRINENWEKWGF